MADDILKNIPLPADLPENWTSDQIVAPTGAEAGLDNQHGYNYLMKQVNNAQKAAKALNEGKLGLHDTADNSNKLNGYELRLSDYPNSVNVLVQTIDEDNRAYIDYRSAYNIGLTAIVASGPNYIRFADGTQICFGAAFNGLIPEVVTYPVAFIATPFTTAVRHWSGPTGAADTEVWIYDTNNTGFKIGSNNGVYAHWIAAGRWK